MLVGQNGSFARGKDSRGDTVAVWEVRFGELSGEGDFHASNTGGDSGKTALLKKEALERMKLVYYDSELLPYSKATGVYARQRST